MTQITLSAVERPRPAKPPMTPVSLAGRLTGAVIATAAAIAFVLLGFAWWWLLALFLVFDLSALGYLAGLRTGAIGYNLVHNYVAPAALAAAYGILVLGGITVWPLAFIAGCWFFHVGADRLMGYGPRPLR